MVTTGVEAAAPGTMLREPWLNRRARKTLSFYVFISPWLIGFLVLSLVPLVMGLYLSFTNYNGFNWDNLQNVQWRHYERLLDDDRAMEGLKTTAKWTAINTPLWLLCSFSLAYILNHAVRGRGIFRTLLFLPSVVPIVAIATAWRSMLHADYGLVNQLIFKLSPGTYTPWLTEHAFWSLTIVAVWIGLGNGMIIFLAGFQNIPRELEEAAMIDGANRFQILTRVVVPLMTPLIFFQLIQSVVFAMQMFAVPLLLSPNTSSNQGTLTTAPASSAYLYMIHVMRQAFGRNTRYASGIAMTWFLVLIIMGITAVLFLTKRFWVFDEEA